MSQSPEHTWVGLAFSFQKHSQVPREPLDMAHSLSDPSSVAVAVHVARSVEGQVRHCQITLFLVPPILLFDDCGGEHQS